MRNIFVILLATSLFFLISHTSFADNTIIQGNAESNTSVTTNIQGSGSVNTHIESTVNGNTKTLDSNKPGTYILNNNGSESSPSSKITPMDTPTPETTPTNILHSTSSHIDALVRIEVFFHQIVQKILVVFHI